MEECTASFVVREEARGNQQLECDYFFLIRAVANRASKRPGWQRRRSLRDPDDVFIHAEKRRKEFARNTEKLGIQAQENDYGYGKTSLHEGAHSLAEFNAGI